RAPRPAHPPPGGPPLPGRTPAPGRHPERGTPPRTALGVRGPVRRPADGRRVAGPRTVGCARPPRIRAGLLRPGRGLRAGRIDVADELRARPDRPRNADLRVRAPGRAHLRTPARPPAPGLLPGPSVAR